MSCASMMRMWGRNRPAPMVPPNLFVDTSGWADPVLHNTRDHAVMEAFYKQRLTTVDCLVLMP